MTAKIAVGETIASAYRFAVTNYLNNLGEIWVPLVLIMAGAYFLTPHYMAALSQLAPMPNPGATNSHDITATTNAMRANFHTMAVAAPYFLALFVLFFVCFASIAVGITREALQLRAGTAFLQFPFGKSVWRVIGAYLLLIVSFIALYIAILVATVIAITVPAAAVGAFASQLSGGGKATLALGSALLLLVSWGAVFYIAVRLSFLLTPVVVAEKRITLLRGWRLTKGNFWRIIIVGLAIWLPLIVADVAYVFWMFGRDLIPPYHAGMTPQELTAWSQHMNALSRNMVEKTRSVWFVTYPLGVAVGVLVYGLINSVSAFAYRSLVPAERPEASAG